ncbi:MAG: efflux RND transporter periplasmic adaptor subunit [Candidatus Latescibacteria bacterium]|nr:efflux RND transporter periplasmic adaptor subunit [Candidatus Latescibacterota bacterium]
MQRSKYWMMLGLCAALSGWSCAQDERGESREAHGEYAAGEKAQEEGPGHSEAVGDHGEVVLSRETLATIGLKLVVVEQRAMGALVHTTAILKPNADRIAHVSPRIPGRVAQSLVALGQQVRQGERLLILDSVELGEAKSAFRKALARLEVVRSGYEREKRLYEEGQIASEKEMLEAKGDYLEAKAEFEAAEERLHLYGLSQAEIERINAAHDPEVSLFAVTAPLSGTVVEKHLTLGELVGPETTVCTIADLSSLWVILNIYEKDIPNVHPGQQVEVKVDAYPGRKFQGTLTYVGSMLDEDTRTTEARVEIDNAAGELKPGMFARVALQTEVFMDALAVPAAAVQREGQGQVVFVARDDTAFARRVVQVGRIFDGWAEITEGLQAGEQVVAEGSFILKSELAKASFGEE